MKLKIFFIISLFYISTPLNVSSNSRLPSETFKSAWKLFHGLSFKDQDPEMAKFLTRLQSEPLETVVSDSLIHPHGTFLTSFARSVGSTYIDPQKGTQAPLGDFLLNWLKLFETDESMESLTKSGEAYFPFDGKALIPFIWQQKFFEKWDNLFFKNADFFKLSNDPKKVKRLSVSYLAEDSRLGLFSTQQYSKILFEAGTNRRAVIHLIEDWNCKPITELMDFTLSDEWVGRDVDRKPGGIPETYLTRCVGCHAGMDALRGAFSKIDFLGDTLYNSARIHPKMSSNSDVFPFGHETVSTEFQNYWITGPARDPKPNFTKIYSGERQFIELLMNSENFGSCLVKRFAKQLCPNKLLSEETAKSLASLSAEGETKLRSIAVRVGLNHCLKEESL